jgi:hypothetical protein
LHIKNLDTTDIGLISINDLILLSMRLQEVPWLQRLTFTLYVDGHQTVAFRWNKYLIPQVRASQFPNLKNLHIRFNQGSEVLWVYNCHSLRKAFEAYDHSDIITFASGLQTFDGPPDWWTPTLA